MRLLLLLLTITTSVLAQSPRIVLTENNSIVFNEAVSDVYVAKKSFELMLKSSNLSPKSPLYLVLNTPGGSVSAGNNFIDIVKGLNRPVHTVTIFAASMGYQIVQELDNRYIIPSGVLMSHRGAVTGLSGQIPGELNERLKMIESVLDGMNERASKRIKQDKKAYQQSTANELWLVGQDAVNKKNADLVVLVTCDKSLLSSYKEEVATIFGSFTVEYSKCPLISYPLSVKRGQNSIPTTSKEFIEVKNTKRKVYLAF